MALLDKKKAASYFKRGLGLLPERYTEYDSSLTSLIFFSLAGLSILGELQSLPLTEREYLVEWTYKHLVATEEGFRGSLTHKVESVNGYNDPANLTATYFCLGILVLLKDTEMPKRLNRRKILDYLCKCQAPNGNLYEIYDQKAKQRVGGSDPRIMYTGCAVAALLGSKVPFNSLLATRAIQKTVSYDGGISNDLNGEAHAGYTYCSIAGLKLLESKHLVNESTLRWLSRRQFSDPTSEELGGFNGRTNKSADTCYSFWVAGSLKIIDKLWFIDTDKACEFLLTQTQSILGGFSKDKTSYPDPLHSYLALCAISLMDQGCQYGLQKLDPVLCLPLDTVNFVGSLSW